MGESILHYRGLMASKMGPSIFSVVTSALKTENPIQSYRGTGTRAQFKLSLKEVVVIKMRPPSGKARRCEPETINNTQVLIDNDKTFINLEIHKAK